MEEARSKQKVTRNEELETSTADRGIIPAEVAARMDREGSDYRTTADEQAAPESIDVTGGATVDQEGLANNYAIEPEMYYDEPGDAAQEEAQAKADRAEELAEVNQDSDGKLTNEHDTRGRGPGII
jgi:hypothetical protein